MEPAVSGKGFYEPQKVQQTVQGQGRPGGDQEPADDKRAGSGEIGRASCRERV